MELIGLIPAAGLAKRLGNIPCSKEILPIKYNGEDRVLSHFLLESFKAAGIKKAHFIIREGKWDIIEYYKNGANAGIHLSYLIMQYPHGVPFTLNEASSFVQDSYVALGFPDMYVKPVDIFNKLHQEIVRKGSDLILGLFPIETKTKWDMVELNLKNEVTDILIKPKSTNLKYGWSVAVWGPKFTRYLGKRVNDLVKNREDGKIILEDGHSREIYPGDLFKEFIKKGNKVDCLIFEDGECVDLGTKDDLKKFQ